jgi:hypothetical protein
MSGKVLKSTLVEHWPCGGVKKHHYRALHEPAAPIRHQHGP